MRLGRIPRAMGLILPLLLGIGIAAVPAGATGADRYLDLPMVNRDGSVGPGGINPELPYDQAELGRLLHDVRDAGVPPARYSALLLQYWLADATEQAGVQLQSWNPRAGMNANKQNMISTYRYYEQLQLAHRELQWAGMAGQAGAALAGAMFDSQLGIDIGTALYDTMPAVADGAQAVYGAVERAAGPAALPLLPRGLAALVDGGRTIKLDDIRYMITEVLVMWRNIFADLAPMHLAYLTGGLPAVAEMRAAGLFGDTIMNAWADIASGEPARIEAGNAALMRREQSEVVGAHWDRVRTYKGNVGEAFTYLMAVIGAPTLAGVIAPREFHPVSLPFTAADGRAMKLTLPLPDWNWSVLDDRWSYISTELLAKYPRQVRDDWPAVVAESSKPFEAQVTEHRPLFAIPQLLASAARGVEVVPAQSN
ncbi:hypothetical protein [Nocardia arthritidis]|uniref:Tat pathway signal protein n=1 Tax=Nocardia arthritidis TaxID=228602 RepID=A0A6G9YL65_9NOCA|nr:hypothetical protein [Nocardia arthritidis]QIS13921.1 hypothetical protein F5544_30385 [Nocardia arthritidis]